MQAQDHIWHVASIQVFAFIFTITIYRRPHRTDVLYLRKRLPRKTCINYVFNLTVAMSQQNELAVPRYLVIKSFSERKSVICKKSTGSFRFLLSSVLFLGNAFTSSKTFLCSAPDFNFTTVSALSHGLNGYLMVARNGWTRPVCRARSHL